MKASIQIIGTVWTGSGAPARRIIDIEGDRIAAVLPETAAPPRPGALVLPEDALLIPGLHDAHGHILFGGLKLGECRFAGVASVDEFASVLERYLREREFEPGAWVQGYGLDETRVKINRLDIDRIVGDRPVFIWSHDLHSAVVNSAALVRARIEGQRKDPEGGRLERDASGKLNGVLRESAAHLVERAIPPVTPAQARAGLIRAQEYAFSLGLTAASSSVRVEHIPHYLDFALSSDRKMRLNVWQVSEHYDLKEDLFERRLMPGFRMATLKGFADGALGSRSAAFWQPYSDDPGSTGMPLVREGSLGRWARGAQQEGYQIAMHAIGDRANSICLDALFMAGNCGRGPDMRPRIEHCQHLREQDLSRFAEYGIIASMQPVHCTADMRFVEPRLGAERAKFSYAWKSLLKAGATLCFGSDWPVEDLSPIAGIHAAVTRQNAQDEPAGGWQSQECLTVEEALRAYTHGSAWAAWWEDRMGTIETGKLADFTVLTHNIFSCPSRDIRQAKPLMTIVGGEPVWQSSHAH